MIKTELIKRSPLRILERSTQGGLGKGNVGVIAAKQGVGKTACLVHIATDQLFQDKHVIHVSFAADTRHIIAWYEDIFSEMASRYQLDSALDIHNGIIKNRIIMNFKQDAAAVPYIEKRIRALMDSGIFRVDTLVIDGFSFENGSIEGLREMRKFASELGLEMWFSASLKKEPVPGKIPDELAPFLDEIAILICLEPQGEQTRLHLLKDHASTPVHDIHLELDPRILLISREF